MAKGAFHVFPDSMARQIGEAYAGFAAGVIEAAGERKATAVVVTSTSPPGAEGR
jgi:hypothetical protein